MPKHREQFNVRLDDQAKADAQTIAQRFHLNGTGAAIRYALHEIARGLQTRRSKGMKRRPIPVMSAKMLLEELEALRNERADFNDLDVYVEVTTSASYEAEQAWNGEGEFVGDPITEGSALAMVVPTGYDLSGGRLKAIGDYVLIRSVGLD